MDIIDIMMAKALSDKGNSGSADGQAAAEAIAAANEAKEAAQEAQETLAAIQESGVLTTEAVDDEMDKLAFSLTHTDTNDAITTNLVASYPSDKEEIIEDVVKLYKSAGENEDGTMTQKAIKDYVDEHTSAGEGGSMNLGPENAGNIVVVGDDGNLSAGDVTEEELIEVLIKGGSYVANDAIGLEIDYENKEFNRIQQAVGKSAGADFNAFAMYGGRRRCIVDDSGAIIAFYGDENYREDSAGYQVMVYQPKFYYQRIALSTADNRTGKIVKKDSIIISATEQAGFKLHPLFKNANGEELEYVLLSAYEGGLYSAQTQGTYNSVTTNVNFDNDKMVSKINTKPLTGSSNMTLELAEKLAKNRGNGWHIFTMEAESANQMLELVEFGTLNGQVALGKGIVNVPSSGDYNCAAITGATAALGNDSGVADVTTVEINGSFTNYTDVDKSAISYRGLENPWGNTWNMLGNVTIVGSSESNGGVPYICKNFNYTYNMLSNDYESVGFSLPNNNGWISNLGYGNRDYDWVLMPAAISDTANSSLPIGDRGWFTANLNGIRLVLSGGSWGFEDAAGPFYYGCDKMPTDSKYKSYGARLMFIPTKNSVYNANIAKWRQEMGE